MNALDDALDLLRAWTPIRSTPGNAEGLGAMAGALTAWLRRELGAEIVADGQVLDPPIVHARIDVGAARTVVLYNMYDVMPADPAGWSVDPFAGGIVELGAFGRCFVGRGAENNKGPLAGMLVAVRDLLAQGRLAVNVEILLEGQEETGSGTLRRYLAADPSPVGPAAAALFPSLCEYGGGPPRLYLGFSGVARGTLRVEGGAWGGPSAAIHGSNAPWIANPAWHLVRALSLLGEGDTGRVAAVPLDDEAAGLTAALARGFDPDAELRFRRTQRYAVGGSVYDRLATVLTTASFSLSTLRTDPPDGRAVIPAGAGADFELRLPPGLDPGPLLAGFRDRLREAGLAGAVLDVADAYPGHRFPQAADGVAALVAAYRATSREPQIWPWAIGAAPAYAFARVAPAFLIGGAGRGGNAHGIDEFATVEGLDRFIHSIALWLEGLGDGAAS